MKKGGGEKNWLEVFGGGRGGAESGENVKKTAKKGGACPNYELGKTLLGHEKKSPKKRNAKKKGGKSRSAPKSP